MEEIILEVKQLFLQSFRMESIELNPERTHILLFSNVVRTLLSGNSYVELHVSTHQIRICSLLTFYYIGSQHRR
jgi:hypothetical protein